MDKMKMKLEIVLGTKEELLFEAPGGLKLSENGLDNFLLSLSTLPFWLSCKSSSSYRLRRWRKRKRKRQALKVTKKLKSQTASGYSNDSNPFGDSNLNEKFVWRKKIERGVSHGLPLETYSLRSEKKKQKERMAEIEKVKKRREERAIEKAKYEEEMSIVRILANITLHVEALTIVGMGFV
ncbi:hypothetical protein NE237_022217 [Protea cynaroides]|uniref:Uncharacterized protein n=1 Tax=Protea cynaroides TaxID=273540 RepID=A0A9Q0H9Y8_9MAGN|nr:hypothetical protein NE237_022217 [Protea cynaroides]